MKNKLSEGKTGIVIDFDHAYILNIPKPFKIITTKLKEINVDAIDRMEIVTTESALVMKKYKSNLTWTGKLDPYSEMMNDIKPRLIFNDKKCTSFGSLIIKINNKKHNIVAIYNESESVYLSFSAKCVKTLKQLVQEGSTFLQKQFPILLLQILKCVSLLQKKNLAHGDIKPANIMFCGDSWKLIDWNMERKLDFDTIIETKRLYYMIKIPVHRGTSPLYYFLHNLPYNSLMVKNYIDDFMMYDVINDNYDDFLKFYNDSLSSYSSFFEKQKKLGQSNKQIFDVLKKSADLHSIGLWTYAIALTRIDNKKDKAFYIKFAKRLSFLTPNGTIHSAKDAYNILNMKK